MRLSLLFLVPVCVGCWFSLAAPTALAREGVAAAPVLQAQRPTDLKDIARDRPSTWEPATNYILGAAVGEQIPMTARSFTSGGGYATDGRMVGWQDRGCVTLVVDLGSIQPIRGVAFGTAAGPGGVNWPEAIGVLVSDDGATYSPVGDLAALDRIHGPLPDLNQALATGTAPPPPSAFHRFWTDALQTHGRWVMLVVRPDGPCIVADDIQVYQGSREWLGKPLPWPRYADTKEYQLAMAIQRRLSADLLTVRRATGHAMLPHAKRWDLLTALDAIGSGISTPSHPPELATFRATLPLDETHARIFAAQAALWRAQGQPALNLAPANPWDPVPYLPELPPYAGGAAATVTMMENEHRSAAFNLGNASAETAVVRFRLTGFPGGDNPPWISVYEAVWTDTWEAEPVAAALKPVPREGGNFTIEVPPGMIRQIWLDFHPVGVPPGNYRGTLDASPISGLSAPVNLRLSRLSFPAEPALHLGGWDYDDTDARGGITEKNRDALIQYLRDHLVDSPWATSAVFPANRDPAQFDRWLARWPGARQYCAGAPVGETFDGAAMGTPEFDRKVGEWIRFWAAHAEEHGLKPEQIVLMLVDEPAGPGADAMIVAWARAIRAAATGVKIFENPIHPDPRAANQEMMALCDVLCPNRPMYLRADQSFRDYYDHRPQGGQELAFYSCSNPARLRDPYSYYRLQAWSCWQAGADSGYFWSFGGDTRPNASSWNEYLMPQSGWYAPFSLDETTVTPGRSMEAIRESVEDYEYLRMLRDAVRRLEPTERGAAKDGKLKRAKHLLATAADRVLSARGAQNTIWDQPKDRGVADRVRGEILDMLESLPADR